MFFRHRFSVTVFDESSENASPGKGPLKMAFAITYPPFLGGKDLGDQLWRLLPSGMVLAPSGPTHD